MIRLLNVTLLTSLKTYLNIACNDSNTKIPLFKLLPCSNTLLSLTVSLSDFYLQFFSPVQNNCLVDEQSSSAHCVMPLQHCPPLLELAARAVLNHKRTWDERHIPEHLAAMLSHPSWCSRCKGPLFNYFSSQIAYRTVGAFYRVPLYEQICTPYSVTCHVYS